MRINCMNILEILKYKYPTEISILKREYNSGKLSYGEFMMEVVSLYNKVYDNTSNLFSNEFKQVQ